MPNSNENMTKRILIVVTNHRTYPTSGEATGLWLAEVTHFYELMKQAGYEMDFVSPAGGESPLDPRSLGRFFLDKDTKRYYQNEPFMQRLKRTRPAGEVKWQDYDAMYYAGGHGTMWDFPDHAPLREIGRAIYEHGGVVSAVCHGVSGVLNIKLSSGDYLINGKRVTGFSNAEETLIKLRHHVPFLLEDSLKARGACYRKAALPYTPYVLTDGRLVTGQNPQSTKKVAQQLLQVLSQSMSAAQGRT